MKKFSKKFAGFIVIIGAVLLVLQFTSIMAKKGKVTLDSGIKFEPGKSAVKPDTLKPEPQEIQAKVPQPSKPEKQADSSSNTDKAQIKKDSSDKTSEPDKLNKEEKVQEPVLQEAQNQSDNKTEDTDIRTAKIMSYKKFETYKPESIKPSIIKLSEQVFVEIDKARDRLGNPSKKSEGIYGWGLVDKYEKPDLAVRTLGGIPFAIDKNGPYYYKISLSENQVRPASMVNSAYSTIGIEANDSKLHSVIKEAFRSGRIASNPDQLKYYYLFSIGTETYILNKVANTFEWFIAYKKYDENSSKDFREKARLRLDVWQALRHGGGEMGIAVPIYFDYNGQKLFLPQEYYRHDSETIKLGLNVDTSIY